MEEWKIYKLEDVCTELSDGLHKAPKFINGGDYIFVNAKNISNGFIVDNDPTKKSTYEEYVKYSSPLNETTVLYSIDGTIGNIALYRGEKCILGKGACYLNANPALLDRMYLYYELQAPRFKSYIDKMSTGSTIKHISLKTMRNYEMKVPSINTQQQIVSILKSLDDKIHVSRRINENLEQQAQALFKSWFVDFEPFKNGEFVESDLGRIPKGWRVEVLGDVCKCILGGTPSRNKEEYWNGNIAWINSGEVNEFRIVKPSEYITEEGLKHSATKLLPKKTTVLAITGATLGQVSLLEIDSCANQSVIGVLENDNIPYEFIYPLINVKITELCSHMTGGAQQHINKNNVEQLNIVLPSENVMAEYKEKTKSIYSQITNCCFESRRLAELRDTLLPKLMSGELKVNEIEK
jgi:type I restriction enzyme S subunit